MDFSYYLVATDPLPPTIACHYVQSNNGTSVTSVNTSTNEHGQRGSNNCGFSDTEMFSFRQRVVDSHRKDVSSSDFEENEGIGELQDWMKEHHWTKQDSCAKQDAWPKRDISDTWSKYDHWINYDPWLKKSDYWTKQDSWPKHDSWSKLDTLAENSHSSTSKRVKFADDLGFKLTSVRTFKMLSYENLVLQDLRESEPELSLSEQSRRALSRSASATHLISQKPTNCMDQIRAQLTLLRNMSSDAAKTNTSRSSRITNTRIDRLSSPSCCVLLEKADVIYLQLMGAIIVRNLTFEKLVTIRYTLNDWASYDDVQARHIPGYSINTSRAPAFDKFVFGVNLRSKELASKTIIFAVQCCMNGNEFWDNNDGANYMISVNDRMDFLSETFAHARKIT